MQHGELTEAVPSNLDNAGKAAPTYDAARPDPTEKANRADPARFSHGSEHSGNQKLPVTFGHRFTVCRQTRLPGKGRWGGKREPLPSSWRMGLFSARKCLSRRKRQSLSSVRPDVPRRSNTSYERSGKKAPETRKQVEWEACRGVQNRPRSTGCGWAAGVPHSRCTAIDPTRQ